jgi:hypothetical protein
VGLIADDGTARPGTDGRSLAACDVSPCGAWGRRQRRSCAAFDTWAVLEFPHRIGKFRATGPDLRAERVGFTGWFVGSSRAMLLVAAMVRLLGLLLALMFSVMPTVDTVCRALCTPEPTSTSAPSCHDAAAPTHDGVWLPGVACQREAVAAVVPADGTRNLVPPAPVVTSRYTTDLDAAAPARADMHRHAVRPRPPQAYPSTIVLRI